MPSPEADGRYLNFEINPAGVLLAEIGSGKEGRELISQKMRRLIHVSPFSAELDASHVKWGFVVMIPFAFISHYFKKASFSHNKQ
jgi:hypothetical protein